MKVESEETATGNKLDFIILIDDDKNDNETNCKLLTKTFGPSSKIECFTHSLEALTYFKNCLTERPNVRFPVPDLVLLDFHMPFYNGFEWLNEFRKLRDFYERKKKVKFLMLTGDMDPELSLRGKTDYSDLLIACAQKPLEAKLLRKIAKKHF